MSVAEITPLPLPREFELYINRELSLLAFNRRVLEQAQNAAVPLLERLKFLCISSTNLDEFFEIRVARLQQQVAAGALTRGPDNRSAQEVLNCIAPEIRALVDEQYRVLNEVLLPALERERIRFVRRGDWTGRRGAWVREYFEREVLPVLSPLGLDPAHPFPRILNKSLNFIVALKGRDAFGRNGNVAVVQAPRMLPRLIQLPPDVTGGPHDFVFLSSIIHTYVNDLFPGMEITGCYQFRATRNSELFVDEEEVEDLLHAVEGELRSRRYGDAVRLEVADNCTPELANFLLRKFELLPEDLYQVNGPVNLGRLLALYDLVDRPELKYSAFTPGLPPQSRHSNDIFEAIRAGDILLHHPFESFVPVVDFIRQAAADPKVLAIKQTLYRTGADSLVVEALVDAARAGKEVTVVVELRARFDEEANIKLSAVLQEAGAHVVYGVVNYKTHAKMALVVRREKNRIKYYVHLGTGNYHERTARSYTDFSLLTSDEAIGEDVHRLFLQLTSLGKLTRLKKLLQSPFSLHKELLAKIEREAEHARAGRPARLIAKLNALTEPQIIQALYGASRAGVRIDLIVRGVCCLRPGVPGMSENIRVRSIVGRFLEHARVYWFLNDGKEELWLASADWMERNLFRRVEIAFPVALGALRSRVFKEAFETYLNDNLLAWELLPEGHYRRLIPNGGPPLSAQDGLIAKYAAETS
ncbi:MAG: polyphosphate kinase 1 [Sulfurifustaceae bacterium]